VDVLGISTTQLQVFLLVLARTASLFFAAPLFGVASVPPQVKVWIAALTSLIFVPSVMNGLGGDVETLREMLKQPMLFAFLIASQCVVGFLIGFAANLLFVAVQMAGEFIDLQSGLSAIHLLNPLAHQPESAVSSLKHSIAVLLFLTLNGHHWLLKGVGQSFQVVPLTGSVAVTGTLEHLTTLTQGTLSAAVKIAAPTMGVLLMTDVVLGLMARTLPQMNVFVVGFPLKITAALIVLLISLPFFNTLMQSLFSGLPNDLMRLLSHGAH
jgi:flagellar biosynthetic protein FliR